MKIRKGFISNSSSSSFTCSYCGENISGMDMYPVLTCTNDHEFCECCVEEIHIPQPTLQEMIDYVAKYDSWKPEDDLTDEEFVEDIYNDTNSDYGFDSSLCPCCTLKVIPHSDLLPYLLKKYNLTIDQVKEMMRNEN